MWSTKNHSSSQRKQTECTCELHKLFFLRQPYCVLRISNVIDSLEKCHFQSSALLCVILLYSIGSFYISVGVVQRVCSFYLKTKTGNVVQMRQISFSASQSATLTFSSCRKSHLHRALAVPVSQGCWCHADQRDSNWEWKLSDSPGEWHREINTFIRKSSCFKKNPCYFCLAAGVVMLEDKAV